MVKRKEKIEVLQLINNGYTQKEAAKRLNVSEKTVGKWVSDHKAIDDNKFETIKNLTTRLNKLSSDKDSKPSDIMYLILCIKEIEDSVFVNKKRSSQK